MYGVVVSRSICIRKASGSIPDTSIWFFYFIFIFINIFYFIKFTLLYLLLFLYLQYLNKTIFNSFFLNLLFKIFFFFVAIIVVIIIINFWIWYCCIIIILIIDFIQFKTIIIFKWLLILKINYFINIFLFYIHLKFNSNIIRINFF